MSDLDPNELVPVTDMNTFAMLIDHWHKHCIDNGNRLLEIPEGTTIQYEDETKPNEVIEMDLNGAYLKVFQMGVMTALNIFKELPFATTEEDIEQVNDQPH